MYLLPNGDIIRGQFTLYDITYPRNWIGLSTADQRNALGIKYVPDPVQTESLEDKIANKKALVKVKRDELELEGFPYLGKVFDSDPRSFYRITTANDLASKDPNFSIDWKLKDNSFITLNAQEMQGVMPALAMWGAMIFANANRLKDLLDNAKTIEEVDMIDINSGWVDINDYL